MKRTTTRRKAVIVLLAFFGVFAFYVWSAFGLPTDRETRELKVLEDFLSQTYGANQRFYVIDRTGGGVGRSYLAFFLPGLPTITAEITEDFIGNNSEVVYWHNARLSKSMNWTLLDGDQFLTPFFCNHTACTNWSKLQTYYPEADRVLILSRVGFNTYKNQALLWYLEMDSTDFRDGESYLVSLKLQFGKWVVESKVHANTV